MKSFRKKTERLFSSYYHFRLFSFFVLFLLTGAVMFTVVISQTPQELRQHAAGTSLGLRVNGNKLVDDNGNIVALHGVSVSGTETGCVQGGGIFSAPNTQAGIQGIVSWKANAIRVPLNEDCWLGINGANPGGATYQQAISSYVNLINQNSLYVILDLHWNAPGSTLATSQQKMADADHAPAFWTSVATAFKGNNAVLFELYNEPNSIPDSCILNGGSCGGSFVIAGMQQLVNAVRTTGATNVILVGGNRYTNDLSHWLANKPTDTMNPPNIAATWHAYDHFQFLSVCIDVSCFDSTLAPVAAQVPLIATEIGEGDCAHSFVDLVMNWFDSHQQSYLPWAWITSSCGGFPSLITGYDGTSTGYGQGVQAHFLATQTVISPGPSTTGTPSITGNPSSSPTVFPSTSATPPLTQGPTDTPIPTVTGIQATPTDTPTPTISSTPTPTIQTNTILSAQLTLPGIGSITQGNLHPLHPSRDLTISLYNIITNHILTRQTKMIFNGNYFINLNIDLGILPTGFYQIFIKTNGYLTLRLINAQGDNTFPLSQGTTLTLPPNELIGGDVAPISSSSSASFSSLTYGDNSLDLKDYNLLIGCYGETPKTLSPSCQNLQVADLNDDGFINGIDYNILLKGLSLSANGDVIPGK